MKRTDKSEAKLSILETSLGDLEGRKIDNLEEKTVKHQEKIETLEQQFDDIEQWFYELGSGGN